MQCINQCFGYTYPTVLLLLDPQQPQGPSTRKSESQRMNPCQSVTVLIITSSGPNSTVRLTQFKCSQQHITSHAFEAWRVNRRRESTSFLRMDFFPMIFGNPVVNLGREVRVFILYVCSGSPWVENPTWNRQMVVWKIIFLVKWSLFRFHVNFPGCMSLESVYTL